MGTPLFAVRTLEILLQAGYDIAAVVTSPDRHAGRGLKSKSSDIKLFAEKKCLRIFQPDSLKNEDFIRELVRLQADLFVVVAFRVLPAAVWKIPPLGTVNLHASLLPQYRGAAPINWVIINGEQKTGVTTFLIDHEIDTGKLLLQEEILIEPDETAGELHERLKEKGAQLMLKTADALRSNHIIPTDQHAYILKNEKLQRAPKIFREDCRINWHFSASDIYNLIRGLSPYPAAYTMLESESGIEQHLKIFRAKLIDKSEKEIPGTIRIDSKRIMYVSAGNGWLELLEIQLEGKARMHVYDFLNGIRNIDTLKFV